jgi:predicted esterase
MRKYILVLVLILGGTYLSPLHGEEKQPQTGGPFEVKLDKPASKYWMYVPEEYTPYRSCPLIVGLHGAGSTAENFIRAFTSEAQKNQYIIAAVKSQGQSWSPRDGDEKLILDVMEHVRKNYTIDPERIFLAGFSAGAAMTCWFGFKNHSLFRGLAPMSMVQEGFDNKAAEHLMVLIVCGDRDRSYPSCKQMYENLKKEKFDTELHTMAGIGHTIDQTTIPWLFEKFQERLNKPDELLKRGKKASSAKRYLDALDCFNKIIEEKKEEKVVKQAREELKKIEKIASDKYDLALKKIDSKNKDECVKLLKEVVTQFERTSVWEKAKEKLNEIYPTNNKPITK